MPKVVPLTERPQQFNVQLPPREIKLLMYYAEVTQSIATAGSTKGQVSIGAFIRRLAEGKIKIKFDGREIQVPIHHTFEIDAH
jgi:hypothetical protein